MTEFISRKHGHSCYEVIIKTTDHKHYAAAEDFARRLIDHAKPMTNADRIRAMSDEEWIAFFVLEDKCPPERYSSWKCDRFDSCKDCWIDWLKEPVEDA